MEQTKAWQQKQYFETTHSRLLYLIRLEPEFGIGQEDESSLLFLTIPVYPSNKPHDPVKGELVELCIGLTAPEFAKLVWAFFGEIVREGNYLEWLLKRLLHKRYAVMTFSGCMNPTIG